jgi:hypothetical protein
VHEPLFDAGLRAYCGPVLVNGILASMRKRFDNCYADTGRPFILPEHLLRALLLQILFTLREPSGN